MSRYLQSTVRIVAGDPSAYLFDWARIREAAAAANVRAWIFRAVDSERTYIEFVEWKSHAGHAQSVPDSVAVLLSELERHGPGTPRQWQET